MFMMHSVQQIQNRIQGRPLRNQIILFFSFPTSWLPYWKSHLAKGNVPEGPNPIEAIERGAPPDQTNHITFLQHWETSTS